MKFSEDYDLITSGTVACDGETYEIKVAGWLEDKEDFVVVTKCGNLFKFHEPYPVDLSFGNLDCESSEEIYPSLWRKE